MLTPAIDAYGLGTVMVLLFMAAIAVPVIIVDFIRWSRQRDRDAARRRHPAGRHRRPIPRPLDADLPAAPIVRRPPRHLNGGAL